MCFALGIEAASFFIRGATLSRAPNEKDIADSPTRSFYVGERRNRDKLDGGENRDNYVN